MTKRRNPARRKSGKESEEGGGSEETVWSRTWLNEAAAIACVAVSVFLAISFVAHVVTLTGGSILLASGKTNPMGPVGHLSGTLLFGFMGWSATVPVTCLLWFAVVLWRLDEATPSVQSSSWTFPLGFLGVLACSATLLGVFFGRQGGGTVGLFFSEPMLKLFGTYGATLLVLAFLLLSLSMTTRLTVIEVVSHIGQGILRVFNFAVNLVVVAGQYLWAGVRWLWRKVCQSAGLLSVELKEPKKDQRIEVVISPRLRRNQLDEEAENEEEAAEEDAKGLKGGKSSWLKGAVTKVVDIKTAKRKTESDDEAELSENEVDDEDEKELATHVVVSRRMPDRKKKPREYVRVIESSDLDVPDSESEDPFAGYQMPPLSLLTPSEPSVGGDNDDELLEKSRMIESKLKDFGVLGKVTEVHPGPVITLFEFEPAPGVKVGRIAALADDLAMGLKASSIRIIAPIPKKGTVGIEIPNKHRDIVRLRDVLESDAFVNADSVLSACIGKDTYGDPVVSDLTNMPHLLMAGATGTGKSVCINAILLSLLYRASPAEMGLILIDPKILELSVYEGIPHLRVPVVTHPKQAKACLQWAVDEMHRRYRLIQKFGVRNIDSYNRVIRGEPENGEDADEKSRAASEDKNVVQLKEKDIIEEGLVDPHAADGGFGMGADGPIVAERLKPLPKIVIVIDEVADLMLSVGRDIEETITRLAQKARAAGIHLIVATQRPSVDVITGLIKANFPARLSFRVSSRIDSRTILDSMGAEKLLGRGDMLFMLPGAEALRRVHGAYVSDNEVKRAVAFVKAQCSPKYDEHIIHVCEKALKEDPEGSDSGNASGEDGVEEYDAVYDKAVELVVEKGYASTSMVQRVFRIGYNRAARIIEVMEKEGIVGPMDGAKPREVLIKNQMVAE